MPNATVSCRFVEDDGELQALAPAWRALPTPAPAVPAFLSPLWFRHWRRWFGETTRHGLLACEGEGRLLGAMPFMVGAVRRGPALSVQFDYRPGDAVFLQEQPRYRVLSVGQGSPAMALEAGMLRGGMRVLPERAQECRVALLAALPTIPDWHVAVLPIPQGEVAGWSAALQRAGLWGYVRQGTARYFGRRQVPPFDALMDAQSHKFRKNVRYAVRQAERRGLTVRVCAGTREAPQAHGDLFAIARRSWKEIGRKGLQFWMPPTAKAESFYDGLFRDESGELQPLVAMIYEGDTPRAGMSALVCQEVMLLCLTFYDPAVARVYPGRLLMKALFEWAHAEGVSSIAFNATHEWTAPFSDSDDAYHQLLVFNGGLYPGLLHRVSRRVAPVLKP